jgi:antitoxin component YwqK of YwqJK toxin-antitoxin module
VSPRQVTTDDQLDTIWRALGPSTSVIPAGAEEVRIEATTHEVQSYTCVLNGHTVGYRLRDSTGHLVIERALNDGVQHGPERHWGPDGQLEFETSYLNGLEHGIARQWRQGRLVGTYRLEHGSGVDLWRHCTGALSEERHYQQGRRHGFERWWTGDDTTVWEEGHYWHDEPHGIFRMWNARGQLRRGYPQYMIHGRRVSKRQYLKAAASDPSLPPFREADNAPQRSLPSEYTDQRC